MIRPNRHLAILSVAAIAAGVPFFAGTAEASEPGQCSVTVQLATTEGRAAPAGVVLRLMSRDDLLDRRVVGPGQERFEFTGLPCTDWTLEVGGELNLLSIQHDRIWERFNRSADDDSVWSVRIVPMRVVDLVARDEDGAPVEGAQAIAEQVSSPGGAPRFPGFRSVRSGPDGRARLLLHDGEYRLRLSSSDEPPDALLVDGVKREATRRVYPVEVHGRPVAIEGVFSAAPRFDVRLIDDAGQPVEEATISVVASAARHWDNTIRPRPDGTRRVRVQELPVQVSVHADDGRLRFEPPFATVETSGSTVEFVARLDEGGLRGRVVDARTGRPVPGAKIWMQDSGVTCFEAPDDPSRSLLLIPPPRGEADDRGRFDVRCLRNCDLEVRVSWPDHRGSHGISRTFSPETCPGEHVFRLDPGIRLRGQVLDRRGLPFGPVTLSLDYEPVRADRDGRFEVDHVAPGKKRLALVPGGPDDEEEAWLTLTVVKRDGVEVDLPEPNLTLDPDDEEVELELRAEPGGRICARVESNEARTPRIREIWTYRENAEDGRRKLRGRRHSADSGAARAAQTAARLCTDLLPPGEYQVQVRGSFFPRWHPGVDRREDAVVVPVEGGRIREVGPYDVSPTGSVEVRLLGWPDDADPGAAAFGLARLTAEEGDDATPAWQPYPPEFVRFPYDQIRDPESWRRAPSVILRYVAGGRWRLRACTGGPCAEDAAARAAGVSEPFEVRVGTQAGVDLLHPAARALPWSRLAESLAASSCWRQEPGDAPAPSRATAVVGRRAECSEDPTGGILDKVVDEALRDLPLDPARLLIGEPRPPERADERGWADRRLGAAAVEDPLLLAVVVPRIRGALRERELRCDGCPEVESPVRAPIPWAELVACSRSVERTCEPDRTADEPSARGRALRLTADRVEELVGGPLREDDREAFERACSELSGSLGEELGWTLGGCDGVAP